MNSQNANLYLHYFSVIILLNIGIICFLTASEPIIELRVLMFFKTANLTSKISSFNNVSIIGINPEMTFFLSKQLEILLKLVNYLFIIKFKNPPLNY